MTQLFYPPCPHAILRRAAERKKHTDRFNALDWMEVNVGVRYDLPVCQRQIGWDAEQQWCEDNIGPQGQGWDKSDWRYKFSDPIRAAQFKLLFHSDKATDPEARYR